MFFWPHLELTEYEKRFNSAYGVPAIPENKAKGINAQPAKPAVLRRMYKVLLNNTVHSVAGLENIHLSAGIQISRASRIFALTFSGDVHAWRLRISLASGTEFTPKLPGGNYPVVSSLSPGGQWNFAATDIKQPLNTAGSNQMSFMQLPYIIDPNWELDPNESLLFDGTALTASALILEIGIHAWEFPGLIRGLEGPIPGENARMGAGPAIGTEDKGRC